MGEREKLTRSRRLADSTFSVGLLAVVDYFTVVLQYNIVVLFNDLFNRYPEHY